jgi:uncharacterized OB-fold protein/acyl dehydratase
MTPTGEGGPAVADGATPLDERLRSFEGRLLGPESVAPDAVGEAMIRHYADAVGDENPIYTSDEAAQATGRPGIVAPPAMLQAWVMPTLRHKMATNAAADAGTPLLGTAQDELMVLCASYGYSSVVATDSEQDFVRELHVGDRLRWTSVIETVSPEKWTALGPGHFVTTVTEYRDEAGDLVATMRFRILLYRPETRTAGPTAAPAATAAAPAGERPKPLLTLDNACFFDGLAEGEIRVQSCESCGKLRHPPRPRCAACGSYDYGTVAAAGTGTLHSYVVVHHPPMPGFTYPLPVGLVDLTEGVRLVAELDLDPTELEIGMPLEGQVVHGPDGSHTPAFHPAGARARAMATDAVGGGPPGDGARRADAPTWSEAAAGDHLPAFEVQLTRTAIIAGALATRDFQDVHHDHELAHAKGAPDIFMNILTTNGYAVRLATDWAGPEAVVERIAIRLGAPNYPGGTMTMSGEVAQVERSEDVVRIEVAVRGQNPIGDHVTGLVRLRLPAVPR